ncbi:MAG TPA: response regulator, partial [Magnetovibrio sp.]
NPTAPNASITATLRESADGKYVIIEVEDTGGGVPQEVLPHIFAPFVTTKESGRGTGLGLSISFGIVQGMNGTIDVANGPNGACFTIQLPTVDQALAASPAVVHDVIDAANSSRPRGGGVEKILVVDDEVGAAHSLSDFLQEIGYLVYTAYNGEEALHLFDSDPVHAVITDYRMPLMSGAELMRELRLRAPDLPVIIMTGQDGAESMGDITGEATEIWKKPLSLAEVSQRLQALADGS